MESTLDVVPPEGIGHTKAVSASTVLSGNTVAACLQAEISQRDLSGVSGMPRQRMLRATLLAGTDFLSTLLCAVLGWLIYASVREGISNEGVSIAIEAVHLVSIVSLFVIPTVVIIVLCAVFGHYTQCKPVWVETLEFLKAAACSIAVGMFLLFLMVEHFSRLWFLFFWLSLIILLPVMRLATKKVLMQKNLWFRPALIVGSRKYASASQLAVESDPFIGLKVVGHISSEFERQSYRPSRLAVRQYASHRLDELERRFGKLTILCAPDMSHEPSDLSEVMDDWLLRNNSITVSMPSTGLPVYGAQAISMFSHDTVLLSLQCNLGKKWARGLKRAFDIIVSSLIILFLSPLLLLLSIAISLDGGSPIYRSRRIGKAGVPFDCFKFRSMINNAELVLATKLASDENARSEWETYFKLQDDPRITRLGHWLRRSSMDELPQLLNVFKGDMSLVGPRPILPEEVETYGQQLSLYKLTRPGITGLWQVCGRSSLGQCERARLNAWYTRNWSLWIDVVILLKTIPATVRGDGAT